MNPLRGVYSSKSDDRESYVTVRTSPVVDTAAVTTGPSISNSLVALTIQGLMKSNKIIVTYYNVLVDERVVDVNNPYMESYPQYVQVSETANRAKLPV